MERHTLAITFEKTAARFRRFTGRCSCGWRPESCSAAGMLHGAHALHVADVADVADDASRIDRARL